MSSSESESSDDEVQKKMSSNSSDASDSEEEVTQKSKKSSKASKKAIESDASSDSDSDAESTPRKKKETKKQSMKRKRNDSESSGNSRIDDSLFTDAADKARWKALSELEKEQLIFERMEARENQRTREQIAQQLKAKKDKEGKKSEKRKKMKSSSSESDDDDDGNRKKKSSPPPRKSRKSSDTDSDDAEFHRPSDINRKHKEKNAMAELKQKRKEIEKKHAKNTSLSIDAVFGANTSDSSSSSSSSASSRSSSRSSSRGSSPDARAVEEEKAAKKEVETMEELKRARLSRFKLGKILHTPFFTKTVQGCFVKVGMGVMGGSDSKYKIWQIQDVEETNKIYDVEGKKTNKGLKCRHGKQERVFRIAYVSNAEFFRGEFEEWLNEAKGLANVPTMDVIEKKETDIKKAVEHKFSDSEVDAIIKEKARFNKVPRNIAMTKADLSKRKEIAQQAGDIREAERIQREIDELEKHADELDKKRSSDISAIAFINYRNRTSNKNEILSGQFKMEMTSQDDPFTRKKGGMKLVSGSKTKADGTISASASGTNLVEMTKTVTKTVVTEVVEVAKKPSPVKAKRKSTNMFDLHNSAASNLDFNINIDSIINSRVPREDMHFMDSTPSIPPPVFANSNPGDGKSRGLSLADYRRRKAESSSTTSS